jgi:ribosome-associated protein
MSETETIRLGQYLKLLGLVATGGEAKFLIQDGQVRVNGEVETRRKRQLHDGDTVEVGDYVSVVTYEPDLDESVDSPADEPGTQPQ